MLGHLRKGACMAVSHRGSGGVPFSQKAVPRSSNSGPGEERTDLPSGERVFPCASCTQPLYCGRKFVCQRYSLISGWHEIRASAASPGDS